MHDLTEVPERKILWDDPRKITLYHPDKKKCVCNGTGLVGQSGSNQSYCPVHRIKRTWPQLQADGSVKFIS